MRFRFILFFFPALYFLSCTEPNDPEIPPEDKTNLSIEVEDVSCTEAWISLKIDKPSEVQMFIDDKETNQFHLSSDTLIYLDTLLPNKNYKVEAAYLKDGNLSEKTSALAQTLDVTSHSYTWETFEFGEQGNSCIMDIFIINENNIWAVGEIFTEDSDTYDSLGNWIDPYNVAHWDGKEWKLIRLMSVTRILYPTSSSSDSSFVEGHSIFAFSENDVWISAGNVFHYDGKSWTQRNGNGAGFARKILGKKPKDMYFLRDDKLIHFNGTDWMSIPVGTNIPLLDIAANGDEIWINGYTYLTGESILLKLNDNKVTKVWEQNTATDKEPYGSYISSIFITNKDMFIDSDDGVFRNKLGVDSSSKWIKSTFRYDYKITGTASNDVYTVGDQGDTWHYNGLNWKQIYIDWSRNSRLRCAAAKDNLLVSGGDKYVNPVFYKALIKIGKRQ